MCPYATPPQSATVTLNDKQSVCVQESFVCARRPRRELNSVVLQATLKN